MMKRYMVILVLFVMFLSVSHSVNAQDSKQIITKQITVSFPTYERAGTYTGEALNGIPNGNGTFTSANDDEIQWTYRSNGPTALLTEKVLQFGMMDGKPEVYTDRMFWYPDRP